VGILRFVGKGEVDVRIAVTKAVGARGFPLVGAAALEGAGGAGGKPLPAAALSAMARELKLAAVIDGRVELEHGLATAKIAVRDPLDGSVAAVETWSVRRKSASALARAVGKDFWRKLGPALAEVSGYEGKSPPVVARKARKRHRGR
jgi:hypothetical protein